MNTIFDGSNATITIDLTVDGEVIQAQTVHYKLLNSGNEEVVPETLLQDFVAGDVSASISILGVFNSLIAGSVSPDSRMLIVKATLESGDVVHIKQSYLILPLIDIGFMQRSYQSLQSAEAVAYSIPNLDMWESSNDSQKTTALIEAFNRIGNLRFKVHINDTLVDIQGINTLLPAYVETLPAHFLDALKRAQVIESNAILGGDDITNKRENGLMSETVGESSTMWRPGKPLLQSVSRKALNALSGYVYYGANIGRG